jgi:hypothetical protein
MGAPVHPASNSTDLLSRKGSEPLYQVTSAISSFAENQGNGAQRSDDF